jgi:hypothetical protein
MHRCRAPLPADEFLERAMTAVPTEPLPENLRHGESFRQSCRHSLQRVSHGKETGLRLIDIHVKNGWSASSAFYPFW